METPKVEQVQILDCDNPQRLVKLIVLVLKLDEYDPDLGFTENFVLKENVQDISLLQGISDLVIVGKEPGSVRLYEGYCFMEFVDFSYRVLGSKEWWIEKLGLQVEDHYKDVNVKEIAAKIGLTYLKADE